MARTRDELIQWVQVRTDESGGQDAVLATNDIVRELDEAARIVLASAPMSLVYPLAKRNTVACYVTFQEGDPYSVIVPLPTDFLRFLRVKLHPWTATADRAGEVGTPEYERQVFVYTRAKRNLPFVAIVPFLFGDYTRALECFPAPDSLTGYAVKEESASGAPVDAPAGMKLVSNSGISGNLPPLVHDCLILTKMPAESVPDEGNLSDAMIWLAASRCLAGLRSFDAAKSAMQQFTAIMPVSEGGGKRS